MQKAYGVQSALLTVKQLNLRFPFINTTGVAGAILGLESEGWMDNWNLLQARSRCLEVDLWLRLHSGGEAAKH